MRDGVLKSGVIRRAILGLMFFSLAACSGVSVKETPVIFWPKPPDPPKISFVGAWTNPADIGQDPSWFKRVVQFVFGKEKAPYVVRPTGITADGEGGVYVADSGLQVVHYFDAKNHKYKQLFQITRDERLRNPIGVAVDVSGLLYVSDADLNRVFVFDKQKKMIRVIGNDEEIKRVSGIAIDRVRGRLYVVDTMGHQVLIYSLLGDLEGRIGKRGIESGTFNFPTFATVDADGLLYISDSLNFRVQVFNTEGKFQSKLGSIGSHLGEFSRPKGVAVDREKNIYVVDTLFDTVQVFNPSGELLLHFGKTGVKPGNFWLPSGIAVDRLGYIYVADAYNKRVQVFQLVTEGFPQG